MGSKITSGGGYVKIYRLLNLQKSVSQRFKVPANEICVVISLIDTLKVILAMDENNDKLMK